MESCVNSTRKISLHESRLVKTVSFLYTRTKETPYIPRALINSRRLLTNWTRLVGFYHSSCFRARTADPDPFGVSNYCVRRRLLARCGPVPPSPPARCQPVTWKRARKERLIAALSTERKQSERSIDVVAMRGTLCSPTRTSLPATGSPTARYAIFSFSLLGRVEPGTRSDISNRLHRLSLSSLAFFLFPPRALCPSYSGVKLESRWTIVERAVACFFFLSFFSFFLILSTIFRWIRNECIIILLYDIWA